MVLPYAKVTNVTKKGKTDPTGIPDGYSEEEEDEADETIEADPMLKAKKTNAAAGTVKVCIVLQFQAAPLFVYLLVPLM